MATDFVQKWAKLPTPLHLSLCHSETEWAIVLRMSALKAPLIALHRVKKMVKISSVVFELNLGRKMEIVLRLDRNWPMSPNISTTTEPIFTYVSALIDVYMLIIKLP